MIDPLILLRQYNVDKKEIIERDSLIIFGEWSWPKTANTNYLMCVSERDESKKEYYTLETLLFFLKNISLAHSSYEEEALAQNIPVVRSHDRNDLLAYLNGDTAGSASIDKSAPLEIPTKVKKKRKRLSGAAYKKLRETKKANLAKQMELEQAAVDATSSLPSTSSIVNKITPQAMMLKVAESPHDLEDQMPPELISTIPEHPITDPTDQPINLTDPYYWPASINESLAILLIRKGPVQVKDIAFPTNKQFRKFSCTYYKRTLKNGEVLQRSWLIYSVKNDSVYCFCCRIFSQTLNDTGFTSKCGYNDWKNLSISLQYHEKSKSHISNFSNWQELLIRLKLDKQIDYEQRLLDEEMKRWKSVLIRLCAIIRTLASQNLPLRGSSCKLYESNNGNFLKIVELFALFDSTMKLYLEKINNKQEDEHYLGQIIQNQLILLMSEKIKSEIITRLKEAKYYSIILDCITDSNHREQISIVVRFICKNSGEIREHFLGFIDIFDKKGMGLSTRLFYEIEKLGININDMRGQSYDSGANIHAKKNGVQRNILTINSRAFYVPCTSHSLNIVINDSVKNNIESITYFQLVQQIYNFFAASDDRWDILNKFLPNLTLKKLSGGRWESHINAIRPIRYHLGQLFDALVFIKGNKDLKGTYGLQIKTEASCLARDICNYKFICITVIWYDILTVINPVSKQLQNIQGNLEFAQKALQKALEIINEYRIKGFQQMKTAAKEIADELEIGANFLVENEMIRRKKNFVVECDSDPLVNFEKKFENECFNIIVDTTIETLQNGFELLVSHSLSFNFLYNINAIKTSSHDQILKDCKDLEIILTHSEKSQADIDGLELFEELKLFGTLIENDVGPQDALKLILNQNVTEVYPNLTTALRILLTIPVSVASAERSFSKLELINNHLKTTLEEERLEGLSMLSIERDVAQNLNLEEMITDFAFQNSNGFCFPK